MSATKKVEGKNTTEEKNEESKGVEVAAVDLKVDEKFNEEELVGI